MRPRIVLTVTPLLLASLAFAQDANTFRTDLNVFLVRYATNLDKGDSLVNITNTGSSNFAGTGPADNICVNVFTYDASEEMVSCCACLVTPNGLVSLSVQGDLISNTLSPSTPTSVVIALVATNAQQHSLGFCDAGNIDPDGDVIVPGMRAWGTTLHKLPNGTYGETETEFLQGGLSTNELAHMTQFCGFIHSNGSGFGVCKSCRFAGLGGAKQ